MEMLPPGAHINAEDYALTSTRGGRTTRLRNYICRGIHHGAVSSDKGCLTTHWLRLMWSSSSLHVHRGPDDVDRDGRGSSLECLHVHCWMLGWAQECWATAPVENRCSGACDHHCRLWDRLDVAAWRRGCIGDCVASKVVAGFFVGTIPECRVY